MTEISRETGISKMTIEPVIDAFMDSISRALSEGEPVKLRGFGSFSVKHRPARPGRILTTGEEVKIPPRIIPVFKAGRKLKRIVAGDAAQKG